MSSFAPEILQNLEFMAIDAYLMKHKLLSMEECSQEYHRPFQSGAMTNKDLVRKLLPKIDKSPLCFYQALFEAVDDPKQDKHPGHSALLKILSTDEGKKKSFFAVKGKQHKQLSPHPSLLDNEVFLNDQSETDDEDEMSVKSLTMINHSPSPVEEQYKSSIKRDPSYHSLNVPASFANQITSIHPAVGMEINNSVPVAEGLNHNSNTNNVCHPQISQGFTVRHPKVKPRKKRPWSLTTESSTTGVTITHQNSPAYTSVKTRQERITCLQQYYYDLEKRVSEIEKVQAPNSSTDCEKSNAIAIEKLQREVTEMQSEHKKSEYNHNEAETYKVQIETERRKATKARDALAQATEQYEAQIKEIEDTKKCLQQEKMNISKELSQSLVENKRLRELQLTLQNELLHEKKKSESSQSTIKRLKDENNVLKTAKIKCDNQLSGYTKKVENQLQIKNELRDTTKAQEAILQELAESKKRYDTLKEMFDKVQIENQDKESMIRNLQVALEQSKLEVINTVKGHFSTENNIQITGKISSCKDRKDKEVCPICHTSLLTKTSPLVDPPADSQWKPSAAGMNRQRNDRKDQSSSKESEHKRCVPKIKSRLSPTRLSSIKNKTSNQNDSSFRHELHQKLSKRTSTESLLERPTVQKNTSQRKAIAGANQLVPESTDEKTFHKDMPDKEFQPTLSPTELSTQLPPLGGDLPPFSEPQYSSSESESKKLNTWPNSNQTEKVFKPSTIDSRSVKGSTTYEPPSSRKKSSVSSISSSRSDESSSRCAASFSRCADDELQQKLKKRLIKETGTHALEKFEFAVQQNMSQNRTITGTTHVPGTQRSSCDYQKSPQSGQPADSKKDAKKGPSPTFLAQKPQMWRLGRNVVPQIMAHWQDVAYHSLHYDVSTVTAIERKCASDPKRCCLELFQVWLTEDGVGHKTWETLLTQLKKVEGLANTVEEITESFKSL